MATKILYLDGITNNEENRGISKATGLVPGSNPVAAMSLLK